MLVEAAPATKPCRPSKSLVLGATRVAPPGIYKASWILFGLIKQTLD